MQTAVRTTERKSRPRVVRRAPEDGLPLAKLTLLTVGLEPPALFPSSRPVLVLPELSEGAAFARILDLAASRTTKGGYLVVVYPTWLPPAEQARLATVRAALQSSRVVLVPTPLPPLAAGVLVAVAAAAARRLPQPGCLVAALPALANRLLAVTWMPSVARLRQPPPTFTHRLASLFPGTGFVAVSPTAGHPGPALTRLSARGTPPSLPTLAQPHGLVVAGDADSRWVERWLRPALGHPPLTTVNAPARAAVAWGATRVVEAVAYPLAVEGLAARLASRLAMRRCGWCGEAVASRPCPFCRTDAPTRDREVDS